MLQRCLLLPLVLLFLCAEMARSASVPSVSIPVSVDGDACAASLSFSATINGEPVVISSKLGPGSDQIILLVLDLTGDLSHIEATKQAAIAAVSKLPLNAWVGLLRDQDGLHVLADPTPKRQPLIAAIQSLSTNGEPGFLETVDSALALADGIIRQVAVRVSLLYLTDGSIYAYREDYTNPVINPSDPYDLSRRIPGALIQDKISDLLNDLRSFEAPLFVVQINSWQDSMNQIYESGIESLATATGGRAVICHSAAEIPDDVAAMFSQISGRWQLTLALPPRARRDIQIRVAADCSKVPVHLSWRTDLYQKARQR
jgi:hypothetical protein